jgi:hypothetical protein
VQGRIGFTSSYPQPDTWCSIDIWNPTLGLAESPARLDGWTLQKGAQTPMRVPETIAQYTLPQLPSHWCKAIPWCSARGRAATSPRPAARLWTRKRDLGQIRRGCFFPMSRWDAFSVKMASPVLSPSWIDFGGNINCSSIVYPFARLFRTIKSYVQPAYQTLKSKAVHIIKTRACVSRSRRSRRACSSDLRGL